MKRVFAALLTLALLLSAAPLSFATEVEDVPTLGADAAPAAAPIEVAPAERTAALQDVERSSLALRFFVNGTESYYKNLAQVSVKSSNGKLTDYGDSFEVEDGALLTVQVGRMSNAYRLDRLVLAQFGEAGTEIENGMIFSFAEPTYPKNSAYYLAVYLTTNAENGYHAVHRGTSLHGTTAILDSAGMTVAAQKSGTMVNVQVKPDSGWYVSRVTATGGGVTTTVSRNAISSGLYSFAMPDCDVTVTADYLPTSSASNQGYSLSFDKSDPGCSTLREQNNHTAATAGDWVVGMAYPVEGWLIDTITVTDTTHGKAVAIDEILNIVANGRIYVFQMPEGDVTVSATCRIDSEGGYRVATAAAGAGGSVELKCRHIDASAHGDAASIPAKTGDWVKVVFTPDAGYALDSLGGAGLTNVSYEHGVMTGYVMMQENGVYVSATFRESDEYIVTVSPSTGGSIFLLGTSYRAGAPVDLALSVDNGYYLKSVTVTTASGIPVQTEGLLRFIMPSEHVTLAAEFAPFPKPMQGVDGKSLRLPAAVVGEYYEADLGSDNGAQSWELYDGHSYPAGMGMMRGILCGTPTAPGTYSFAVFARNGSSNYQLIMCTLNVTEETYDVSADASPADGGKVSLRAQYADVDLARDGKFRKGCRVYAGAEAKTGMAFAGWYAGETLVSSESSYSFTAEADTVLTARFEPYALYPVCVQSADPDTGSAALYISRDGTSWMNYGSLQQLGERDHFRTGVQPASGYHFKQWLEDPTLPEEVSVSGVTGAYALTAVFEKNAPTVTYKIENGTWADGSTEITETVDAGGTPANVPTDYTPGAAFGAGAWDVDPAGAVITEDTTFTYTCAAKIGSKLQIRGGLNTTVDRNGRVTIYYTVMRTDTYDKLSGANVLLNGSDKGRLIGGDAPSSVEGGSDGGPCFQIYAADYGVGTHELVFTYPGDETFAPSEARTQLTVIEKTMLALENLNPQAIRPNKAYCLSGRLVGSDGAPAAGKELYVFIPKHPGNAAGDGYRVTTDQKGVFRLEVSKTSAYEGDLRLIIRGDEDGNYAACYWEPTLRVAADAPLPGDLDADGEVSAKDITVLRRLIVGGYDVTAAAWMADLNRDGFANAKDVTLLRRYVAGGYGVTLD